MSKRPKCYDCCHRRTVIGNTHSECAHPEAKVVGNLLLMRSGNIPKTELNIKGNQHGINNGWFYWPTNFDPTWLERCDGFEPKE